MIPLKKKWRCHPIEKDDKVLDLAAQAGAWYVYQTVFGASDRIRDRIRRYHDIYVNPKTGEKQPVFRHSEIDERLVEHILRCLGLKQDPSCQQAPRGDP
jgi:hypothetical protein